jgi:ABC-type branched-subunit amino acid transport system ATPase component/predicted MFS family arabinose efflux permease
MSGHTAIEEAGEELASTGSVLTSRRGLAGITLGVSALPLVLLFVLNFVDEFDRVAFAALAPEIRDAFHLTDAGLSSLRAVAGVLTLFAALPLGILADRTKRVRISVIAGFLWGICAMLTGVVGAVFLLFLVRFGSGLGRIINEVVHPSLLGDYYPQESHPKVFGAHRLANAVAPVAGPVAGYIGATYSWQAAFFVLAVPTAIVLVFATRLREPARGESIDAELAAAQADDKPVPFAEARRQLFAVPTLRRLWIGAFFFGLGTFQLDTLLSLYFERVYNFDPKGRGWVQFLGGAGLVVGLAIGARLAARASAAGDIRRLPIIIGGAFTPFAAGMVLLAVSPAPIVALFGAFLVSAGVGAYQPAYFTVVGAVAPPRVRSQSYAWAILIYGAGGLAYVLFFSLFGGEEGNYRGLTFALALITAAAGFIGASASRSVKRDAEQASTSLAAAARMREELEAGGERALLICKGVDVAYGTVQILFGVDLEIKEGEIVALLGTNGAGKSTILKAISGLVDPIGGAIYFDGRDITHADAVQAAQMGIVQVPGGKAIFPTLTVAEHFKAGAWLFADEDPAEVERRTEYVLDKFPRIRERWSQMAGNLSGGEQQQLALGMAFVAKPKLLIIDELSLGLAPTIVELLLNMVREIHAQGCTIILVEQSVNVALTVADRAYFLEKGEVRFEGRTDELLARGDILRSVFLEGAGKATTQGGSPGLIAADAHVDAAAFARSVAEKAGVAEGEPVMSVQGLTKRFGGISAVNDVTFEVMPGEIVGLIGPNGAGKTTIFDLISGLLPLDAGRITFRGEDVTRWGADRRARLGLGRSFQDARIFPSMTVSENIALGLERHIEVRDHLSPLLGLPAVFESEADVAYTVDDLIELMNLGAFRDKFVAELSTGSRRIVDLAMSIAHDPTVLILDEPSSGIAQRETEALGPLLKRIQREAGCAMLIIEHDMPLITTVSDRMIALELGAVVTVGTPDEVISNPQVISSYLGGDIDVINRSGASAQMAHRETAKATAGDGTNGSAGGSKPVRRKPLKAGSA